jgi:hypothetical protein
MVDILQRVGIKASLGVYQALAKRVALGFRV